MRRYIKRILFAAIALLLSGSILLNFYLMSRLGSGAQGNTQSDAQSNDLWNIHFPDANSRDTYASIHNLKEAHKTATGSGIKVGILDWGFGFADHEGFYAGGKDFMKFSFHEENFNHASEHGFWMAQTLKEIAPDAEIYALGTYSPDDEEEWVDAMIEAIDWSMDNDIDILTLSHQAISSKNRERFDQAVNDAIASGIVTTFIHYDNPDNILPWGIWNSEGEGYYQRAADINIFQYDYNTLFTENYARISENADFASNYRQELFLSVSSMSVVTGEFVALLKEADNTLTPQQCKEILISTSHPAAYEGEYAEHVVDMGAAIDYLRKD